jgi:hypothetical protein
MIRTLTLSLALLGMTSAALAASDEPKAPTTRSFDTADGALARSGAKLRIRRWKSGASLDYAPGNALKDGSSQRVQYSMKLSAGAIGGDLQPTDQLLAHLGEKGSSALTRQLLKDHPGRDLKEFFGPVPAEASRGSFLPPGAASTAAKPVIAKGGRGR